MSEEIWKDIYYYDFRIDEWIDFRGLYQVSNLGHVKSLNYNHTKKERELKYGIDKDGYRNVILKGKQYKVHRLVAHMFISNPENKPEVDHIIPVSNGGTDIVDNLRWATDKENCNNKMTLKNKSNATRGENNPMFGKHGKDNPLSIAIEKIDKNTREILKIYNSITEAKEDLGLKYDISIRQCLKEDKRKTAHGFIWKYHKE